MKDIVLFFETKVTAPRPFGAYHLACLALLALCVALLAAFGKKLRANPRTVRRLTAGTGGALLALEAFKQVLYGLHAGTNGVFWEYPWWIFPLQMCSTPLYACVALFFCPEGRIRRALCCYLGTFGMFGGIVVMLLPATVFTDLLFANLHTMLWHIALVSLGILQWCGKAIEKNSDLIGGAAVFLVFAGIAVTLDCALPQLAEEGFNMFYLSPYIPASMSGFAKRFWELMPYPVYLLAYLLGFTGVAAAIFFSARAVQTAAQARQTNAGAGAYGR